MNLELYMHPFIVSHMTDQDKEDYRAWGDVS